MSTSGIDPREGDHNTQFLGLHTGTSIEAGIVFREFFPATESSSWTEGVSAPTQMAR